MSEVETSRRGATRLVCIGLGLAAAIAAYLLLPQASGDSAGLTHAGRLAAAVGVLMAAWWMTEAIPLEVTGLIPLVAFPLLGVSTIKDTALPYAGDIIFLFLGGMLLGQAMERWGVHTRLALAAVTVLGSSPARLIGGFLLVTAFISMWVSNTAATVMMLPIGASVAAIVADHGRRSGPGEHAPDGSFAPALVLAIAFGATIGGVGTVIGTPPIAQYAAHMKATRDHTVSFLSWLRLGLPVLALVLPLTWFILTRVAFRVPTGAIPGVREQIAAQRRGLGPWSPGGVITVAVFSLAAVAWVGVPLLAKAPFLEGTGAARVLGRLSDAGIAIGAAVLLFVLPADLRRGEFVMTWHEGRKVPWGILLLFGGGLSLATALTTHGVDAYIASLAGPLHHVPLLAVLVALSLAAIVLTEFASNTALVAAGLPVAGAIAERLGLPPAVLLVTVTLSASLGFMLPGGTAPNALVFSSGRVSMRQMMKAGLWLDVACGLGVPLIVYGAYRLGILPGL